MVGKKLFNVPVTDKAYRKRFLKFLGGYVFITIMITYCCNFTYAYSRIIRDLGIEEEIHTYPVGITQNESEEISVTVRNIEQAVGSTTAKISLEHSNNFYYMMEIDSTKPMPKTGYFGELEISEKGCAFLTFEEIKDDGTVRYVNTICNLQCDCDDYVQVATVPKLPGMRDLGNALTFGLID